VPHDLRSAAAQYRAAQKAVNDAKAAVKIKQARLKAVREELTSSIVAAAKNGVRMRDLVKTTGLSHEWIRLLLRQNGVHPED
jgi:hypothetical protein